MSGRSQASFGGRWGIAAPGQTQDNGSLGNPSVTQQGRKVWAAVVPVQLEGHMRNTVGSLEDHVMTKKDCTYLLTHSQEKALHCPERTTRAPYLVRWIMCDGMGPRIFSIITKCSRFSWV